MEQNNELMKIKESLSDVEVRINDQTLRQLNIYVQLIKSWSKKINLVSKNDVNNLIKKHLIPCLWFSEYIKKEKVNNILDIGSGAGFPGIVIKIMNPNIKVVLVDSIRKKTLFLKEVANETGISVDIQTQRIEKYMLQAGNKFDAATCRAVGKIADLWRLSDPIIKKGGALYLMKGGNFRDEIFELSAFEVRYKEIKPDNKWTKLSINMNAKAIIKVERKNEK